MAVGGRFGGSGFCPGGSWTSAVQRSWDLYGYLYGYGWLGVIGSNSGGEGNHSPKQFTGDSAARLEQCAVGSFQPGSSPICGESCAHCKPCNRCKCHLCGRPLHVL